MSPTESSPLEPFLARLDEITANLAAAHADHPLLPMLIEAYDELCERVLDVPHDQAAVLADSVLAKLNSMAAAKV